MPRTKTAVSETGDPLLLTPGPLTTSASVKQAMVHDWGSRDAGFLGVNKMVLEKIVELAGEQALTRGHLRIAADSAHHVVPIMAALRQRADGLTFALSIDNSAVVLERLLRHEADVAVMAKSVSDPRLHAVRLRTDRLVLFVPARHALAKRGRVPLGALAGQELVLRERGSITREVLEQAMAAADIQPGAIVEVQTREGVREAVAAGFGIGAVFASELGDDRRFRRVLVSDTDLAVAEYAVSLQERRRVALVRAFMEEASHLGS